MTSLPSSPASPQPESRPPARFAEPSPLPLALVADWDIAPSSAPPYPAIRHLLAALLAADALQLPDLQIIRDLAADSPLPGAWLLPAAMLLSVARGNAYLPAPAIADVLFSTLPPSLLLPAAARPSALVDQYVLPVLSDLATGPIVLAPPNHLYFARHRAAVVALNEHFARLARTNTPSPRAASLPQPALALLSHGGAPDPDQLAAVQAALANPFTVITGGPGTGKTTVVSAILAALLADPDAPLAPADIALCSPTGRAAQRLGESIKDNASRLPAASPVRAALSSLRGTTIDSLLGGRSPNFAHNALNPLLHKAIFVDEVSMVDLELMANLADALPTNSRLVLIGDPDQLPPVETGAVLGDIARGATTSSVTRLDKTYRFNGTLQAAAHAIQSVPDAPASSPLASLRSKLAAAPGWEIPAPAPAILDSLLQNAPAPVQPALENLSSAPQASSSAPPAQFHWIHADKSTARALASAWAAHFEAADLLATRAKALARDDLLPILDGALTPKAEALFAALEHSRILTVLRRGPLGVDGINRLLAPPPPRGSGDPFSRPGVPVLITQNDHLKGLFNGDIGVTVLLPPPPYAPSPGPAVPYAIFRRGRTAAVACPCALLPAHQPAYAITVHKSQGSEFDNILLLLPDDPGNPLLTRELLYTGLTRARRHAILLALPGPLDSALSRRSLRLTGLRL